MGARDVARGAWDRTVNFGRRLFGGQARRADAPSGDPRGDRLAEYDGLYHAEQYDGRGLAPPWDKVPAGAPRQPLRFQRPAVVYPLAKVIVDRPTSMLFGEARFPKVSFELANPPPDDPPEPLDPDLIPQSLEWMPWSHISAGNIGFNAGTGKFEDMVKAGVIDPAKVTRSALQNAASIAALFLTTEVVVADKPEKAAPAMPGGDGGMGDMGF